jgi:Fic family protein
MLNLDESPYLLDPAAEAELLVEIRKLEDRVLLLRNQRILTTTTLARFYGQKRFEYVAESNALEGSTLSTGETELAVLKGVTITGHDPGYVRDAVDLDNALQRLTSLARKNIPIDIEQIKEIHTLILGERPGAGMFRRTRVQIKGSKHTPPKSWSEVMSAMEQWERWSVDNGELPAPIRATVLHAWLVYIHPFIDGNGRAARALTTLELIRSGYPPIVIRRKERRRYLDALAASDDAGDLADMFDLFISRENDSLRSLELAAKAGQGYDPIVEQIKKAQQQQLKIWNTSLSLLAQMIEHNLNAVVAPATGRCTVKTYHESLDLDSYLELCAGRSISKAWTFTISMNIPGYKTFTWLAWLGFRSNELQERVNRIDQGGPSIFWSIRNTDGYPPWVKDDSKVPAYKELTTAQGSGDEWFVKTVDGVVERLSTTAVASTIAEAMIKILVLA